MYGLPIGCPGERVVEYDTGSSPNRHIRIYAAARRIDERVVIDLPLPARSPPVYDSIMHPDVPVLHRVVPEYVTPPFAIRRHPLRFIGRIDKRAILDINRITPAKTQRPIPGTVSAA